MGTNLLQQQISIPSFELNAPYSDDVWYICEWDLYKNASKRSQQAWNARSNVMGNTMDFTLCHNNVIREEIKYFSYYLLNEKNINVGTFAEYADKYKLFFDFINGRTYSSVLDIDTWDYEVYLSPTHKTLVDNGSALIGQEIVSSKRRNRSITFLDYFKNVIFDYFESKKPIFVRDVWHGRDLAPDELHPVNLVFSNIEQPAMKQAVKAFLKMKITTVTTGCAYLYLKNIKIFCHWLYEYDEKITSFKDVTRDILEDYFIFLRVESDFSQHIINVNILQLSCFFEYGLINCDENFPDKVLFLSNDHCFKTKRRASFYTDEEIVAIFSLIKYLPKIYGKILLVLHHTGMRVSEVLRLPINSLKEIDGKHYLAVYMYKTERFNNIPIDDYVYKIISSQIDSTRKKFPDSKYVFVNSSGKHIGYSQFVRNIKKRIVEHNVLGRDGELLDFKTHRFRSTKATQLINMGQDPKVAADMMGHKDLASLTYYAVATEQSLQSQMQEYLKKESILINSIGKIDSTPIEEYENAHPLCNGWCCKPVELGLCDKINACLTCSLFKPSLKHLATYKLQLTEVQSSLAVAEANKYDRMASQCKEEILALENIIKRLEEKL